jgi:hypothetical protein
LTCLFFLSFIPYNYFNQVMDGLKQYEFYVTLQSNSSRNVYPKNVQSAFTNCLKKPLKLNDEWVVGVTEIFFNSKTEMKKIRKRSARLEPPEPAIAHMSKESLPHLKKDNDINNSNSDTTSVIKPTLQFNIGKSNEQFGTASAVKPIKIFQERIKESIEEAQTKRLRQTINEMSQDPNDSKLSFPSPFSIIESLLDLLRDKYTEPVDQSFEKTPHVNKLMYLYLDIIKPRFLGDQYVRCIRVIPSTSLEEIIHFNHIEYYPVELKYIESISVLISDDQGEKINFKDSFIPFYCTLHFKKKSIN